jgi:hypothetical protein
LEGKWLFHHLYHVMVLVPVVNCVHSMMYLGIKWNTCTSFFLSTFYIVRDSSAIRQLFVRLAGAVGHQSALHKENSGFAAPTLHISTFRGYQILFSIRNPSINHFTNHFSIHSQPSYPQKVVFIHSITARFCLRPHHFAIWLSFSNICHMTFEKTMITAMYHGRWFAYMILPCPKWEGGRT